MEKQLIDIDSLRQSSEVAVFAGGCFWCMQEPFDTIEGVQQSIPGYTGGHTENPDYASVCSGTTGHKEAVLLVFDSSRAAYTALLHKFWRNIDPTQADGQFADRGSQYTTAIFYLDEQQRVQAEQSKEEIQKHFSRKVVTEILPYRPFYRAESVHCNYYQTNSAHYKMYSKGSGRVGFIQSHWKNEQPKT